MKVYLCKFIFKSSFNNTEIVEKKNKNIQHYWFTIFFFITYSNKIKTCSNIYLKYSNSYKHKNMILDEMFDNIVSNLIVIYEIYFVLNVFYSKV